MRARESYKKCQLLFPPALSKPKTRKKTTYFNTGKGKVGDIFGNILM